MDITPENLLRERRRYFTAANGGIALPVAGAIYWIVLAALGTQMQGNDWGVAAAMLSGAIFPLGFVLQWPLKSHFMRSKSPVSGAVWAAVIAINFLWPVHFVIISAIPAAAPLTLAIGMTLHWLVIGWAYASRVCYGHAIARLMVVTVLWYGFPEMRFTILPLAVAGLYLLAAGGMRLEVNWTKAWLARTSRT